MAGYGDDSISINVYLLPLPGAGADLQTVLLVVPQATNSLNGSRYRSYASTDDVTADEDAGYISATTAAQLTDAFSQSYTRPETILVGRCDLVGGEHYDDAIEKCIDAGADFFGVCLQTDTASEHVLASIYVETLAATTPKVLFIQSSSVDWYGATWPAGYSTVQANKWSAIFFHDTVAQPYALCVACSRLAFDPNNQSAAFRCELTGVASYAAALTTAQKTNALANHVNLLGSGMGTDYWSDLGLNFEGRAIDHLVSAAWLRSNLLTSIQAIVRAYAARGRKLPVNTEGARILESAVAGVANQGVSIGHFDKYTDANGIEYPKTSSTYSRTNNSITITMDLFFANQVQTITVNAYLNEAE